MRKDAQGLFKEGMFAPDGLTNTAAGLKKEQQGFSKADRQTFRNDAWDGYGGAVLYTRAEATPKAPVSLTHPGAKACETRCVGTKTWRRFDSLACAARSLGVVNTQLGYLLSGKQLPWSLNKDWCSWTMDPST